MRNKHFVFCKKDGRKEIKRRMQTTDATVSDALNYKRHSELCRRIRSLAVNNYNGIYF